MNPLNLGFLVFLNKKGINRILCQMWKNGSKMNKNGLKWMKPIKQAKIQKLVVFVKKSWFGRNKIRLEKVLKSRTSASTWFQEFQFPKLFVCVKDLQWFSVVMWLACGLKSKACFSHNSKTGSNAFQISRNANNNEINRSFIERRRSKRLEVKGCIRNWSVK